LSPKMDLVSTVGVAGAATTFMDFSYKFVSTVYQIY
jgi:hypothetical protein